MDSGSLHSLNDRAVYAGGHGELCKIFKVSWPLMLVCSAYPEVQMNSTGLVCMTKVLNYFKEKSSTKFPRLNRNVDISK